jgi:gliding motility-associated-like protein
MGGGSMAQCPSVAVLLTGGHCVGDTLTVHASGSGRIDQIVWYNGSQVVKTVTGSIVPYPSIIVAGGNDIGRAADQLNSPVQVYVDGAGYLYVADEANNRIQRFPPGSTRTTNGVTIIEPVKPGDTARPPDYSGVYLDKQGNVYTESIGVVQRWALGSASGVVVARVTLDSADPGYVNSRIFVDEAANVYVVESDHDRVQKWTPGADEGVTVAGGNGRGPVANQLHLPLGCFADRAGNVYVADALNHRIQKWAPGASTGITVAGGDGPGSAANQLDEPNGVFVDANDTMYIADNYNQRIQQWAPGASVGVTVAGGNGKGSALNQLRFPSDVFFSNDGWVYTCDNGNNRILKNLPGTTYYIDTTLVPGTPGTYTAVVTEAGCSNTTNALAIVPEIPTGLRVQAQPNPVCGGDSVLFIAQPDDPALPFQYQWLLDSAIVATGPSWVYPSPSTGDVVICNCRDEVNCAVGRSDSVVLTVDPPPSVQSGQVFSVVYGQSILLTPVVSGNVAGYNWSPATGLSDAAIAEPIASVTHSTVYELRVVSNQGCVDSGAIDVNVFSPLRLPNAFTPNGDGKNDIFYVIGGPSGEVIKQLVVFDRWGHVVFRVKDVPAGDPAYGWDGRQQGHAAAAGTYVYTLTIELPGQPQQVYHGTVELIR